jgi:hypothetical protein
VFTGLFEAKRAGEHPYVVLDGESGREGEVLLGKVPAELIRREVPYDDLPEGVRKRILETYRGMWGLDG